VSIEGMNVDAVRQLSRDLRGQSVQLDGVCRRVDGFVSRTAGVWQGRDASDFVSWWRDQHRPKVMELVRVLEGLAQSASNNADEQEKASGGSTDSSAGLPAFDRTQMLRTMVQPDNPDIMEKIGWVSTSMDYAQFGMVLKYGAKAVDALDDVRAWKGFNGALGMIGIFSGTMETAEGVGSGDYGKAWGGVIDVALGTAGMSIGAAAAPIVVPLGVAKTFVDATIPYSTESQDSLLDYQAERMFHTDRSDLTPEQSIKLANRYEGFMGGVNMISDKMDQTAEPIAKAGDAFFRWIGLKK